MMIDQFDSENIYCRRLGHTLKFDYCRMENKALPCSRIMDCWFERIEIQRFIESNYTKEERNIIFSPPKDRLSTIFDLIAKASANIEKNDLKK